MMYPRTFKYIDKDRILPALNKRRRELIDSCMDTDSQNRRMDLLSMADEIGKIIENIEMGMYDWQPSQ